MNTVPRCHPRELCGREAAALSLGILNAGFALDPASLLIKLFGGLAGRTLITALGLVNFVWLTAWFYHDLMGDHEEIRW